MSILNVKEPLMEDNSLIRYEYHSLLPFSANNLGNNDEIRIPLHQEDVLSLPSESRIYVEGTLTNDPVADPIDPAHGLVGNAIAFLFSEIRYEVNGILVDRVRNPGVTSLLKGLPSFTNMDLPRLANSSWMINTRNNKTFNFCVPLKYLLGFAEDYKKVMINTKQELILTRARTNNNALILAPNSPIKLALTCVQWQMPFVNVCDQNRLKILNLIESNTPIQLGFRSWQLYEYPNIPNNTSSLRWQIRMACNNEKPRFVIVGFQTGRNDVITADTCKLDKCNVRSVRLIIGSDTYPYNPLTADFTKNHCAVLYENYAQFRKNYYHDIPESSTALLSHEDLISAYPIWVIDCSHQSETVKTGAVDVRLEIEASQNFPADTTAYCLTISDTLMEYVPFSGIVRKIV